MNNDIKDEVKDKKEDVRRHFQANKKTYTVAGLSAVAGAAIATYFRRPPAVVINIVRFPTPPVV